MTWQPMEKLAGLFDPLGHAVSAWLGIDLPGQALFSAVVAIYILLHFAAAKLQPRPDLPRATLSANEEKRAVPLGSAEPRIA